MNGTLVDKLRGFSKIHVDSNVFIYFLQDEPPYAALIRPVFEMIANGALSGITSIVTVFEVLVKPLRDGRKDVARQYAEALFASRNLLIQPVGRSIAEVGAQIRAQYGVQTPDAIQLGTALLGGAQAFLTNDRKLARITEPEIVVLRTYVAEAP